MKKLPIIALVKLLEMRAWQKKRRQTKLEEWAVKEEARRRGRH